MKKLLLLALFFLLISCTKTEIKEIVKEVETNSSKDTTFIKFTFNPSLTTVLQKYVVINFKIAYRISNNYLPMAGGGFKVYNTLMIDNGKTQYTWSSKQLRYRIDTLTFKYESQYWLPKTSVKFYSEIAQMNSANDWYPIAITDTLKYSVSW